MLSVVYSTDVRVPVMLFPPLMKVDILKDGVFAKPKNGMNSAPKK
jgi:hypothetical protein